MNQIHGIGEVVSNDITRTNANLLGIRVKEKTGRFTGTIWYDPAREAIEYGLFGNIYGKMSEEDQKSADKDVLGVLENYI
ncbi:hypothetical protein [Bhargavaea cecembensis]|uniref:hypothetical protein n=1 Tax=Bhargavaea cecembensis TaxID=394098 RepID=UPI00058E1D56|nr:hypothetical protein [Bhargavaea cecembensis]